MDSVIANRYRVIRRAGHGGMGVVYHAEDLRGGGEVALKIVAVGNATARRRFAREAAVLASLKHPAIVRYLDHGTLAGDDAYLAMEWVDGETLDDRLEAGELRLRDALALGIRLADALGHAHRLGIVHRDIKPSNILLPRGSLEQAKLIDFGVARGAFVSQVVTQGGMVVGTPAYMAPEQARGADDVDARADVFALGCVLYRCIGGRAAYSGDQPVHVLLRASEGAIRRISDFRSDIPGPVDYALAEMLAFEREDRPMNGAAASWLLRLALRSAPEDAGSAMAITSAEQRLVAIVAATTGDLDPSLDAAVANGGADTTLVALARAAKALSLGVEALPNRIYFVPVTGAEVATDLATRAAHVARTLRQAVPSLRIAVATGLAEKRGGQTLGHAVEVATAALGEPSASPIPPGEIWLDEVTAGLLDGRAALDSSDSGYRLVPGAAADTGPRRLRAQLPFRGRERELRVLDATFDEVLDDATAQALIVVGAAGIGKSRLIEEALARAAARSPEGLSVFSGRGDPTGESSPFALVAEAVRRAADIFQDEPEPVQLEKLRVRVARSVSPEQAEDVAQKLAMLIGLSRGSGADATEALHKGDLMRRAFEELLAAEAERGPVVVVLEDLQWGDLPSVLAVDGLMRRLAQRPLWVIGVGRSELVHRFPGLWAQRNADTMSLGELGRRAAERVVCDALGERAESEVVAQILDRAGGNPVLLDHLVRSARAGSGALPETILALVALRLEQLSTPARRALRAASIVGMSAWTSAIRALLGAGVDSPTAREAIEELVVSDLLERRSRSRFAGEEELAFTSAAVREAAYDTLTPSDRATGHRLAAEWLEQHGESDAIRLAEQWTRAGERARAAGLFGRAAHQALEGADFVRCVELCQLAREHEADGAMRARWLAVEAEALGWSGRFEEMNARAAEALGQLAPGSIDWCRAGAAMMVLGGSTVPMDRLIALVGSVAFMPLGPDASQAEVRIQVIVAMLLYRVGQAALGNGVRDRVLAVSPSGEGAEVVRGWKEMVRVYESRFATRLPHETYAAAQRAAAHLEAAYDLRLQAMALVEAGYAALALGRFDEAVELAERGCELAESLRVEWVATYAGAVVVGGLARAGRLDEARERADSVITVSLARHDGINAAFAAHLLAVGELDAGNVERARELALRAQGEPGLPPTTLAYVGATLARCELRAGRAEEGLVHARQARRSLDQTGAPDLAESWIAIALIEALVACGRIEEAAAERAHARARLAERARTMSALDRESFLAAPESLAIQRDDP